MADLLSGLNDKQQEAVLATQGPVLIVAGAGSGKTRALTHRIAHMIENEGVSPWNILAVTFTNKAAGELKERLSRLIPSEKNAQPTAGTFHSICVQILRRHIHLLGYENHFVIYDGNDQVVLMKELMKEHGIDEKQMNAKAILGHISQAKNQLMGPDAYAVRAHSLFTQKVAELYKPYQQRLARSQALDFDDLIGKTVELFRQFPEVLESYQERFRFISVDEYQDTNHAQYILIQLLAAKYRNICVIGDPDQSIYSWRGANMQNILDFEKDYPEAKVIKLEQNYRSTSVILDAAHAVIEKNRQRKDKRLWTSREGGEKIRVWTSRDERDEAFRVAEAILKQVREQNGISPDYRAFAVLYRTNAQSRTLEEAFMRYGIPYKIIGGVKFYARKEVKDILAYLRVIFNPHDTVSLLRIINTPARKIGAKTLETIQFEAVTRDVSFFTALQDKHDSKPIEQFAQLLRHFQELSEEFAVGGLIKHVIVQSGYKAMLEEDRSPEGEERLNNIQELISVADKYEGLDPRTSLATFLEEISLMSDLDDLGDEEQPNSVTLMTLHSAKGLEFPTVFLTGLEEGVFPHSRSLYEPQELEEERRLMYVGITRAMNMLYLLHAEQRLLFGEFKRSAPSQFLLDIPEDLIQSNIGFSLIQNDRRGEGSSPLGSGNLRGFSRPFSFGASGGYNERGRYGKAIPVESDHGFESNGFESTSRHESSAGDPDLPTISLDDEPHAIPDFHEGDRVVHRKFGEGLVLQIIGGVITVAFKDPRIGVKKLSVSLAPLSKL